jgi:hypothetical protein
MEYATGPALCYHRLTVASKNPIEKPAAALNIRDIPRDMFFRLKMAAAVEQKTVRDLLLELIEAKIQELEKKGLLPKGK